MGEISVGGIDAGGAGGGWGAAALALVWTLGAGGSVDEVAGDAGALLGGGIESGSSDAGGASGGVS